MKKLLLISALFLAACGEELPLTQEAYHSQTILKIKDLSTADKKTLFDDVFQQNADSFKETNSEQLGRCLGELINADSGFIIFSRIIERCQGHYEKNPAAFFKG